MPLFQRPYVWNQEIQWEPLWEDVARVAERLLTRPQDKHHAHFLGAVVLQQVQRPAGHIQERTIIDGQQRLTTLQLLMDALHAELMNIGATAAAMRMEPLVRNADPFCAVPDDRFKVWPTNRDREAFKAVMAAEPPVNHNAVVHRGERMVEAHRFFSEQAREWLQGGGSEELQARATAIEGAVRDLLQMVVIDLSVDENAQEIFETLNARGAQLTAADLIKNFAFQRLMENGADVQTAYERQWKEFETGFWETEVSVGRVRHPRSAIFLNHWLIAQTGKEVVAREVFKCFKTYSDFEAGVPMATVVERVHDAAATYRRFVEAATSRSGAIDRIGLFGYRTGVMESEVIKPLVMCLLDPHEVPVSSDQLYKALDVVESWMVRRMLVRATTKNYNQVVVEVIKQLRSGERARAGEFLERFLAEQKSDSRYWPDDEEVRGEVEALLAYRRLSRSRLRMVLEAIEDHLRGFRGERQGLGGERVARGAYAIEHVMPRKWATHWPTASGGKEDPERDRLVHTIGNLTLLTGKLNSKVSNGPWRGRDGKREALEAHCVLFLNRDVVKRGKDAWTEAVIRDRSADLAKLIVEIWPVPPGHRSAFVHEKQPRVRRKVSLADLISAGALLPGIPLFPSRKKFGGISATLLPDGQIDVNGKVYSRPSDAATAIVGRPTGGWWFFVVDQDSRRSLRNIRSEYVNAKADDLEDDDDTDEDDEEES